MKIKVTDMSYHRNGIGGNGFHVALFDYKDEDGVTHKMVGTVFDDQGSCAVYDVDMLKAGNIAFANGNSWRGDHFEGELRRAIEIMPTNRIGPFALPDVRP